MANNENVSSVGRRELILRTAGIFSLIGLGGAVTRAATAETETVVLTPQEEQGPYFVDGQLERSDVLYDTNTKTVQAGLHLFLNLTVNQVVSGVVTPLTGARVDIWEANASGVYSDEQSEGTAGTNYLRGYQIADASGKVNFLTIYPGWYSGRTPHIHIMVRLYSGGTATYTFETQFFFSDAISAKVYELEPYLARATGQNTFNTNDRVFNYEDCDTGVTGAQNGRVSVTDAALLQKIDVELSRTVPEPMEPLARLVAVDRPESTFLDGSVSQGEMNQPGERGRSR